MGSPQRPAGRRSGMPLGSWMLKDFLQAIIRTIKDPGSCWNGWDSYIREMSFTAPQDFIILPMRKGGDGEALRPRCSRSCRETAWRKIWKKAFSGAGRQRRPEPTWHCFRKCGAAVMIYRKAWRSWSIRRWRRTAHSSKPLPMRPGSCPWPSGSRSWNSIRKAQGTRCFYWTAMGNVCCPMRRSIPVISRMSAA